MVLSTQTKRIATARGGDTVKCHDIVELKLWSVPCAAKLLRMFLVVNQLAVGVLFLVYLFLLRRR
jgi:hypothetical protein